jgi:cytochrome c5
VVQASCPPVWQNRFQLKQEKTLSHDKQFFTTFFAIMGALAVLAIILIIIAISLTSEVSEYKTEEVVLENLKPVGQVYVAGESEPEPEPAAAATAAAGPKSGDEVYKSSCAACHSTGAAGSPKLGDAAAWAPRIAQGMDTLLSNATNGLKAMPPKGLCMTCSDAELQAAVEYIVNQSQ